ncbi:hypothetical protein OIU78_020752 [Salix suchowensis]|nr:hypothetical protein OIU78_020752 [Salix suchowensis]
MEAPQERSPLIYQSPVVPAIRREDCPGLYTELQIELTSALDQISNHQVGVDLEALLRGYIYYFACCISTGYKPRFTGLAFSEDKFMKATDDA